MKKMTMSVVLLVVMLCFTTASAQFKTSIEPKSTVSGSILKPDNDGFLFGLINPDNFSMHHSFSLSYQTFGGQGLSMGMYTNSMAYKFSDNLDVNADISLMASPYNTLGKQYQSSLSGLFLNRAELNYRPWKNTLFQIQYQQLPASYMMGSGFYGGNYFLGGLSRYQDETH
ncbi:MAG TPA: hypothetical protein VMH23_09320 [Bacteroidota bacterium]|nr:hypothetical protein [Bacteroidota bacterium]